MQTRILGSIIGMALDNLADQAMSLSVSGKYAITGCFLTNLSGSGAPNVQLFKAPGGGATDRIVGGGTLSTLTAPDQVQQFSPLFPLDGSGLAKTLTAATVYARVQASLAAGMTGDLYLMGVEV
jgi:hypothetical protein